MKILYVTHKMFYPVDGGDCIRMSQMLDSLLRVGVVDVMYISNGRGGSSIRQYNSAVRAEWSLRVSYPCRLLRAAFTLVNRNPLLVNLYRHRAFVRRLVGVAPGYDMVVLGGLGVAGYCIDLKAVGVDAWLDLTDSAAMNLDNEVALSTGLKKIWNKLNARRMRRLETQWRATCRVIAFISEVDRDYIEVAGSNSVIVGNKVDLCDNSKICEQSSDNEILFVGKMSYAPNVAAVSRFAVEVLPHISSAFPGLRFRVVGASPVPEVKNLSRLSPDIIVEGFVDDLSACYREASIVVAPMFSGSGIQNKILQAMAAGCCVVTTPIGAEGLDISSGAFVMADDDRALADACIRLLGDRQLRRDYGARARAYVAVHFSDSVISAQMSRFLSFRSGSEKSRDDA